jgi:hypothetical protein
MCGLAGAAAASGPGDHAASASWHAGEMRLLTVRSGSRSYMEGRGFQSYRRDRGFSGPRNFGSYPSARGSRREERPYSLERRRIHGPSDNRCAGWARRCAQDTGDAPGDYQSCMRYHGCR